jgi:1-acyl-sn-glycerol-3-phosphate acyltransferase
MTIAALNEGSSTVSDLLARDGSAKENRREKVVPELYEKDASKYAGPHRWQIRGWAKLVRRAWRYRAYTRWVEQACERIDVIGAEHLAGIDGPCVFVANHASHLDTLVVDHILPERIRRNLFFGAAQDRWFVKGQKKLVLKPWYQSLALGNFPVMRGGGAGALAYAHWLLKKRQHVFLFPEGTRSTKDELGAFKHGPTLLALENDVPIVPIYLAGLKALRPKATREVKRGSVQVVVLPPLRFSESSDVSTATAELHRRMSREHAKHMRAAELRSAA